jgi:hypothetical protein
MNYPAAKDGWVSDPISSIGITLTPLPTIPATPFLAIVEQILIPPATMMTYLT